MSRLSSAAPQRRALSFLTLAIFLSLLSADLPAEAQPAPVPPNLPLTQPPFVQVKDRITSFIDEDQRVTLRGNVHPLALAEYDAGAVASDFPMEHMLLMLLPDAMQQEVLNELVDGQYSPESPYYHQWLTPEQYGERFGVSDSDAAQIVAWLRSHDMQVEELTAGHRSIIFSGTAAQVQAAFHTPIHIYKIGEEVHHANVNDPEIPAALVEVVGGVVSLHDFHSEPTHGLVRQPSPDFSSGGANYLAPADFATIYDVTSLYQQSINGNGQSVAIVARSNIKVADARQFRTFFGLPANDPQIIVNGTDPGIWSANEETEADLDVEWSGAVARSATIKFVASKSTNSSDGVDLSAQYIFNHNLAPVMSTSFGLCEAALGSSGNSFLNSLWQQAAAEGITVFVSSGDSGAAGCDSASASRATHGRAVNGLCSTPYSICVGGTEFNDVSNATLYWSPSSAAGTQASALSYIPEVAWNASGPDYGLWASGGGASIVYPKPSWQAGTGVPADGKRDVPDVALSSAGHDGYLIYQNGEVYVVGGTSAASPSFAGVMALVVENTAARQGNANVVFYSLASKQRAGGASLFHDITVGNNSVPGQAGGSNKSVTLNVTVSGGFNAAVTFSITGLPSGVSGAFTPAKLSAPGSGSSLLKLAATSAAKAGTYSATVSATSGATKQQMPLSVIVVR
jgi:pseudomonalisin